MCSTGGPDGLFTNLGLYLTRTINSNPDSNKPICKAEGPKQIERNTRLKHTGPSPAAAAKALSRSSGFRVLPRSQTPGFRTRDMPNQSPETPGLSVMGFTLKPRGSFLGTAL
ncbi:uncharacterized protein PGTG_18743 [Puccinia graminis f. sp. tritici CRL 75-36-700-3]|uniref:Uncharacterized protein n=1 Tax=Puccinia graminis f. sp. tritici (strain CRL 75-36-700-3 / race SCCL) TaxID=418459 RepID=E3L849_PUCGT|nr:uncharacterized protein PGTG_18743 [Puccinia graminis f. sp. tritici CRL 75-36-700-3]EFP92724.1 hypothetical protein PGTG_18743 [Puccinia graminis f. sp. tritici CRL 75-36-700-3]